LLLGFLGNVGLQFLDQSAIWARERYEKPMGIADGFAGGIDLLLEPSEGV
jgi:hypothetical protein